MWKGVSHGIGCLKETLVTVCAERAKGREIQVWLFWKRNGTVCMGEAQ